MDYDLLRIDYALCGVTYPDTLKILPTLGSKTLQKFAIGDKNGVLQCLAIKDEEPIVLFKTLPGKAITSVQLAAGPGMQNDKIFAASGNEVKGYTRKGKVFLTLETTLSETITSMSVIGGDLVLGSGRVVTHFRDLQELHSYTCEDRILDIAAFSAPNSTKMRLLVLIANKGAMLLESGEIIARLAISAGPTRLLVPRNQHSFDIQVLYGAADGSIGVISYNSVELSSKCLMAGGVLGAVVSVGWWTGSMGTHLVIGRHDGSVQLYVIDLDNLYETLRLKFTYFCGEPVTSVTGGCVGTEEGELLAATFSGRIFALRPRHLATPLSISNMTHDALAARRSKLETEISRLEKQVAAERDKYQRTTRALHGGLSAPPLLDIQYELRGATRDGWQEIHNTSAVPLDMLFVYCSNKLDLETDSAAVLSVCLSQVGLQDLLATVRCQAGTRRLWIKARMSIKNSETQKAESASLLIYALPAGPPRVARLITLRLPALPYYTTYGEPDKIEMENRPWCKMDITGGFSVAEMTSWLDEAFPGELPRPGQSIAFARIHSLLNTTVIIQYKRNVAKIKSDNVSTLTTLKDLISNCSVKRSIRLEINCDIPGNLCLEAFERIENIFEKEYTLHKDSKILKAMSALDLDVGSTNEEVPQLCEDYLRILKVSTPQESYFQELVETILQWYKDWRVLSLHGGDGAGEILKLTVALQECCINEIKDIFRDVNSRPISEAF